MAYSLPGQADELQELIRGCVRNERAAQEKVYRLFYGRMMALVRRYIDRDELVEEVLNNGFLRAFQRVDQYGFQGSFEGWLRKVIFHAVCDYVKKNVRYEKNTVLTDREEVVHRDLADRLYYNQLLELVQRLPGLTRPVFNMYVMEGLTHLEIAKILNISEGTSKWHMNRGREILKEKIEKLGLHLKQ
ncbi:MAG: RNA polymerase sigma factor [Bacteroidetes bacterium]|nr:RNA polymerase sigma factor [Bacteroidota bacterium]